MFEMFEGTSTTSPIDALADAAAAPSLTPQPMGQVAGLLSAVPAATLTRSGNHVQAIRWDRLVPLREAAGRLGVHPEHLSRQCRERLEDQGYAIRATPPGEGGREQWFLYKHYDPRLISDDHRQLHTEPDLAQLTQRQRDGALMRRACVERLRQARQNAGGDMRTIVAAVVAQCRRDFPALKVSRSTLYAWDRAYRYPCDLVKLVDSRGGDRRGQASPEAWDAFRDLFLHANRPTVRQCWKTVGRLAAEHGWHWVGYDACLYQLNARIPPQEQARHRDPATYRQVLAPFIAQDPESWRAGELWIGDHKQLDLVCRFGQSLIRPWLTTWMDWRTRRVVGWVLSDAPNSTTILAALRHGLLDKANQGGPRCVWIDNGKDYDAWLFHGQTKAQRRERIQPGVDEGSALGIFHALAIEAHFATPYNPNGKARLERWFRTLETFARTFETYTGQGVDDKPERLNEILANPRLVPTFDEVRRRIADHIAGNNARVDHDIADLVEDGQAISPDQAMARWNDRVRVLADPAALELLLAHWHRPVTVGRNGVSLCLGGLTFHYGQFEPALAPFKAVRKADRKNVLVAYDPHDLRSVRVHDEHWRYLCTAEMNGVGGMHGDAASIEHIAELNRRKARYDRAQRDALQPQLSITSVLTNEENLVHVAAESKSAQRTGGGGNEPPTEPHALQIVRTPLDGEAQAVERDQLRAAVGAESPAARRPFISPVDRLSALRQRRQQPAAAAAPGPEDLAPVTGLAAAGDELEETADATVATDAAEDRFAKLRRTYGQ